MRGIVCLLGMAGVLAPGSAALASVEAALQRARTALEAGRAGDAVDILLAARAEAPADPAVYVLLARAHLNAEDPNLALQSLQFARGLGASGALLDRLEGEGLLAVGRFDDAADALGRAARARPDDTATALLLGTALVEAGRPDAARAPLARAAADPALAAEAEALLAATEGEAGAPAADPWRFSVEVGGGYDDNVQLLPEVYFIGRDRFTAEGSPFLFTELGASTFWSLSPRSGIAFSHDLSVFHYTDVDDVDYEFNATELAYRRALGTRTVVQVGVENQFASERLDPLYNRTLGALQLEFEPADLPLAFEARGGGAIAEFFDDPRTEEDRDAVAGFASGTVALSLETGTTLALSGRWLDRQADGDDEDVRQLAGSLSAVQAFPFAVTLSAFYQRRFDRYDNRDSIFGIRREDDVDVVQVQVDKGVTDRLSLFGRYTGRRADSNIDAFDYDQNVWTLGARLRF